MPERNLAGKRRCRLAEGTKRTVLNSWSQTDEPDEYDKQMHQIDAPGGCAKQMGPNEWY